MRRRYVVRCVETGDLLGLYWTRRGAERFARRLRRTARENVDGRWTFVVGRATFPGEPAAQVEDEPS